MIKIVRWEFDEWDSKSVQIALEARSKVRAAAAKRNKFPHVAEWDAMRLEWMARRFGAERWRAFARGGTQRMSVVFTVEYADLAISAVSAEAKTALAQERRAPVGVNGRRALLALPRTDSKVLYRLLEAMEAVRDEVA